MKAVFLFALIGLAFSAPQPRKLFHEHFGDFIDLMMNEVGSELQELMEEYAKYDEFWVSLNYMKTNSFKVLIDEMEHLPEFNAVIDFLENDNIDINFFIDDINSFIAGLDKRNARITTSGRDLTAFITDVMALYPKEKLAALFDQKMAEVEEFRTAIENLYSDEWAKIFGALWANETFQVEVQTLLEHGIDAHLILHEVQAIFGQY